MVLLNLNMDLSGLFELYSKVLVLQYSWLAEVQIVFCNLLTIDIYYMAYHTSHLVCQCISNNIITLFFSRVYYHLGVFDIEVTKISHIHSCLEACIYLYHRILYWHHLDFSRINRISNNEYMNSFWDFCSLALFAVIFVLLRDIAGNTHWCYVQH